MRKRTKHTTRRTAALAAALVVAAAAAPLSARDYTISGDYVEARTSDVYTGPCFANGEVNVAGKEAILAWRVADGAWDGVPLAGLSVVAVVRANATLGDPYADPLPARSVLVVDEKASQEQRQALVGLAREMAGDLLSQVEAVEAAPVEISVASAGFASVVAGDLAVLRTRALNEHDHLCGNEEVFYPPLVGIEGSQPAVTLEHTWSGAGLDSTWKSPGKRSAFVGTFVR